VASRPYTSVQSIPPDPQNLATRTGLWLQGQGPEADVVISSRVRLARNLRGLPFRSTLTSERSMEVPNRLKGELLDLALEGETTWVSLGDTDEVLRRILFERSLATRELVSGDGAGDLVGKAVAFGAHEGLAALIGEEDHLRLQCLTSGLALEEALERVVELDRQLESRVSYATRAGLGYLTACPSNVGTGMRASVMLHLPALGAVRSELQKVFHAAQHTGLAVRGLHGEGSKAIGDLYQMSNQVTLGASEPELIARLMVVVRGVVRTERRMRQSLLDARASALNDRVARGMVALRSSRALSTDEALRHLSVIRFGHHVGLVQGLSTHLLNRLALQIQQGHLHALQRGGQAEVGDRSERSRLRAALLRSEFAGRG
jgi:protein arginine kinase